MANVVASNILTNKVSPDYFFRKKFFLLIVTLSIFLGIGVSFDTNNYLLYTISVLVVLLLSLGNIKYSLVFLVIWTYIQHAVVLSIPGIPRELDLLDELILIGLTINWVVNVGFNARKFKKTPLDIIFVTFLCFYLFSVIMNSVPYTSAIFGSRDILQYILLFYILVQLPIEKRTLKTLFKIIFVIGLIQFPFTLFQLVLYYGKTGSLFVGDYATGTLGQYGAHKLGYFMGMMIVTVIGLMLYKKRSKLLLIISLLFFVLTLILSSTRAAYFITPVVIIYLFKNEIFRRKKYFFLLVCIIVLFVFSASYYTYVASAPTLNLRTLYNQQKSLEPGTLRRVGFLGYSFNTLNDSSLPWLGVGPGMYVSKTATKFKPPLYRKYRSDFPFRNAFSSGSQISPTLVEYGYVGIFFLILIFLKLYGIGVKVYKMSRDEFGKSISFIFRGVLLIYLLGTMGVIIFELQPVSFYAWFLAGLAFNFCGRYQSDREEVE